MLPLVPAEPPSSTLDRGQAVDRFVVIGLVGRGGMGEVYAAYDPELDRKVAIKLLRSRGEAAEGRTRLLREAQAIAKLSHPNVVVVYDVGTFGDSVFVAMEFVEGRTLTGWLQAATRSRREIMQVFLAAGRGLAAAHAAGLVHRDFKPDNVMVTNDGQVRVMDFGLARQMSEPYEASRAAPTPRPNETEIDPDVTMNLARSSATTGVQTTSGKYLSVKLTQTGAMMGTPAYMAPEQFALRPTDARTDQFSFCVALYECLYGQRPFDGATFLALMTTVTTGALSATPAKAGVPGWLRKVVVRGLETDPARRHASMSALLVALETDPTVRRRRMAFGLCALAIVGIASVGARRVIGARGSMCRGGGARWTGVWEANGAPSARKTAIRRAFEASGRGYAAQAFASTSRLLDDYVARWIGTYTDVCEATHVRGEQSTEVLDLRMSCLQDRFNSVNALSDLLARADGTAVENAVAAAGALPRLDRCTDVAALRAVVKVPEDPKTRKRVDDLRVEVSRLTAARTSGHCDEAEKLAESLIPRVRTVDYPPLLAEALVSAGFLVDACTEISLGLGRMREAFMAGISSGQDEAAATAAMVLGGYLADRAAKPAEGRQWVTISKAILKRLGHPPLLEAWVLDDDAMVLLAEGRGEEAATAARDAADGKKRVLIQDHPDIAISINTLGNSLHSIGRDVDALVAFKDARERFVRGLGASHPSVAMVSNNEGEVLNALHRYADARVDFERALAIWRISASNPIIESYGLTGLGLALIGEGHGGDAIAPLERALTARTLGAADSEHLAETRFALARALWTRRPARGRALLLARQARAELVGQQTNSATTMRTSVDEWLATREGIL